MIFQFQKKIVHRLNFLWRHLPYGPIHKTYDMLWCIFWISIFVYTVSSRNGQTNYLSLPTSLVVLLRMLNLPCGQWRSDDMERISCERVFSHVIWLGWRKYHYRIFKKSAYFYSSALLKIISAVLTTYYLHLPYSIVLVENTCTYILRGSWARKTGVRNYLFFEIQSALFAFRRNYTCLNVLLSEITLGECNFGQVSFLAISVCFEE